MKQYLDMCRKALETGEWKQNRTGVDTIGYIGDFCQYDLAEGFPIVTTKHLLFKSCVAEMLGFLRGYTNAQQFRDVGSLVWDANANSNEQWLANPNRGGKDDLGRIYGAQARNWRTTNNLDYTEIDQLKIVVEDLSKGIDNRREIVTHWNPGEIEQMALPPCHLLYQFCIQAGRLHLLMYQRSCDLPLGVPFNITGYSWLLSVIAHITGLKVGVFHHTLADVHIYRNQVDAMKIQLSRAPWPLPNLNINPAIKSLEDLETWVTTDDFTLVGYQHAPAISYKFSV